MESKSSDNNPDKNSPDYGDIDKDFESGETNFPHGAGYPNIKNNYDKVVDIQSIYGVAEEDVRKFSLTHAKALYEYVNKYLPFLSHYNQPNDKLSDYLDPENPYVLDSLTDYINRKLKIFTYWSKMTPQELEPLKSEAWREGEYIKAHKIAKQYPNAYEQIEKLERYIDYIDSESPHNSQYKPNYPLFVTLYDTVRALGGSEEGGWWYDNNQVVKSIKVDSYEQADRVARQLVNNLNSADLDGQAHICLEKEPGSRTTTEKPSYN